MKIKMNKWSVMIAISLSLIALIDLMMLSLAAVYLALGLLLSRKLTSNKTASQSPLKEVSPEHIHNNEEIDEFVERVNLITSEQIDYLESEQQQVRDLINQAVEDLTDSFNSMRHINEQQNTIFTNIFKKNDESVSFEEFVHITQELLSYFVDMVLENGKDSVYLMQKLDDMTDRVNSVLSLLDSVKDVSSSINLLSLNASIEAARAGDAGRGFSVVAQEIRSLSTKADEISDQINQLSQEMIEKLHSVTEVVNRVASNDMNKAMEGKKKVEEMTDYLTSENKAVNDALSQSEKLSETLSQSVSQAIVSLQFEDMCRQLLEHLQKRLNIVKRVNQFGIEIHHINLSMNNIEEYQSQLNQLSSELLEIEPDLKDSQHQSVKQKNLDTTEVEFF